MAEDQKKKVFEEFPPITTLQWEEVINSDLKGADYEKKLISQTHEGISLKPYYRQEDTDIIDYLKTLPAKLPFSRGRSFSSNDWLVRQDIDAADTEAANRKAHEALMKGAGSIGLILEDKREYSNSELTALIKEICPVSAEINFVTASPSTGIIDVLISENASRGGNESQINGSIEYDPLGSLLTSGNYPGGEENAFATAVKLIGASENMPGFRVLNVDASNIHNAGGTAVQELGFAMAAAAEYMERFTKAGISAGAVAEKLKFTFAAGSNYFMEIAKFRAARYLWAKLLEAWDLEPTAATSMVFHAVTSRWNKSVYDPYVNMLRTTTEAMSAVLGGADSMTVEPFDKSYNSKGTPFSERVARNTQLILKEEAYFDKVSDPAAGSYYIESLTNSLIEESWKLFLETQDAGGFSKAFVNGVIQSKVGESAAKRDSYIATRRDILVGTNQYPNLDERVAKKIDFSELKNEITNSENVIASPLKLYRGAAAFEELRIRTELNPGGTPKVFLLPHGDLAMRKARAGFASAFFGCAGYEIIEGSNFESPAEAALAAVKVNASVVVLCSSDEEYPDLVSQVIPGLQNDPVVVVAGYPKESMEQLKSMGVQHFIHIRSNLLETLQLFHNELGIK